MSDSSDRPGNPLRPAIADSFFERLVNALPSIIWIARSNGHAEFFNQRWYQQTGLTPDRSVGMGWSGVVHPDDRDRLFEAIGPALTQDKEFEIELRYRMANGQYRWHLLRGLFAGQDSDSDRWFGISIDIDKKHSSEEMSEAQTMAIVETAVDGIITIDDRGIVCFFNPAAERIFGYEATEVLGKNLNLLMPEPDRSQHDQHIADYLHTGVKKVIGIGREVEGRRKNGTTFAMDLAVSELRLSGRRMFTGIVRDISERKRLDAERRAHTRLLERLTGGETLDGVLAMLIEFAKEARPDMSGSILLLDPESGCLRHTVAINLPDFFCQAIDGLTPGPNVGSCGTAAFTGQRVIVEDIATHRYWDDYREVALRASLKACWSEPIISTSGDVLGTFAMYYGQPRLPQEADLDFISNIANLAAIAIERVEADKTVRQLAAIVESTNDAVIGKRLDGTIESWNHGAERIYGYSASEAIGQPASILVPVDRANQFTEIDERLARGDRIDHLETVGISKDGQRIDVSITISSILDDEGNTIRYAIIARDVTALRDAQAKLLQSERLAAMGQMLSGIAHESRNALQRIQAGADMLELEIEAESEAYEDLARITRAREDLNRLFDELRSFAAPIHLERRTGHLVDAWRQAWTDLDFARRNRTAELCEETDGVELECRFDLFRIEQVFRNLIENSLAACRDPVRIEIQCKASVVNDLPAVSVTYRDNGPGLSKEQRLRIFDSFYTTKTKGTGLGMAIAKRIVEAHGGTIRVLDDSPAFPNAGIGAAFEMTLPKSSVSRELA